MPDPYKYDALVPDTSEFADSIARRLQLIYKQEFHEGLVNRILALSERRYPRWPEWTGRDIMLITYGNSICEDNEVPLRSLHKFLKEKLSGIISCVHILPFFPYTSDDGFAVSDFINVNHELGSWDDIQSISSEFSLMTDLVINHASSAHTWFKNFLQNRSPGRDYFIEKEPGADYSKVIRPRSTPLFTSFDTSGGKKEIWTTFSPDQIDLNFANPEVLLEMIRILTGYIGRGARFIRLDAIAFLWKRAGTSCLHLDETHEIVKLLRDVAEYVRPGTIIITETNVPNRENWSYFGNGDEAHMVYQFSLPPLLLQALFSGNSRYLSEWAAGIPVTATDQTFLNYTASHDGIGIRPLEGLIPDEKINEMIEGMIRSGGLVSMRSNNDGSLSPYEINITWFDAMKGTSFGFDELHEARYICSQAIMMSLKGIPAFYIHSLLATPNDYRGVELSGRYRSINRSRFSSVDLARTLSEDTPQKRIFNELTRLIKIRKDCPAFHPDSLQEVHDLGSEIFAFTRTNIQTGQAVHCISNITNHEVIVNAFPVKNKKGYDLISGPHQEGAVWPGSSDSNLLLKPYQTMWIAEVKRTIPHLQR